MKSFILWALGLVLIFIEFYLPGAIMGIAGGILVLISVVLFSYESQSPLYIFLYIVGVAVSIGVLIKFAIWRIRTAKPEYSIYSNAAQTGFIASTYDKHAVGKTGTVLSDLKPGGYILVDGKQHQAISQEGYIVKGTEVIVLSGQEESLIVKPIKKEYSK